VDYQQLTFEKVTFDMTDDEKRVMLAKSLQEIRLLFAENLKHGVRLWKLRKHVQAELAKMHTPTQMHMEDRYLRRKELITPYEVAKRLNISHVTAWRWAKKIQEGCQVYLPGCTDAPLTRVYLGVPNDNGVRPLFFVRAEFDTALAMRDLENGPGKAACIPLHPKYQLSNQDDDPLKLD
jgi:hypothetical protein